ncbi:MAG: hypothetical protein EG823_07935 [Actinobacteria bacterium]|nr:hypothetical protein [Actinomycetota bacterium]
MQLGDHRPQILESWEQFVRAHEALALETGSTAPTPLALTVAFAGALVASLAGGVVDPKEGGARVLLPDGTSAVVAVAFEDVNPDFGLIFDPASAGAEWVAMVVFAGFRPTVIHVLPVKDLAGLRDMLGLSAPRVKGAPATAISLTAWLHWDLCVETAIAALCGVLSYPVCPRRFSPAAASPTPRASDGPPIQEVA